jgi:hypothetical protein
MPQGLTITLTRERKKRNLLLQRTIETMMKFRVRGMARMMKSLLRCTNDFTLSLAQRKLEQAIPQSLETLNCRRSL